MIAALRYNLKIVAPTLLWTGLLVGLLVLLVLFGQFQNPRRFNAEAAGSLAEQLVPLIAAFFAGGVLDAEMKRGAHELLRSKRQPLWQSVALRVVVALGVAFAVGWGVLAAVHFGIKRVPLGMLLLASIPSSLCLALISLWTRIRLGNAFMGYAVALAVWLVNLILSVILTPYGIVANPLLTLNSYTDRLRASAAGALETTPYVDWWWVPKIALLVVSGLIFLAVTRRVEHLIEGD